MANTKRKTIAIILILTITLSVLPIGTATTAFAAPNPNPNDPAEKIVYYFTDYSGSAAYCTTGGLLLTPLANCGFTANNIERHYWPNGNNLNYFWESLTNYFDPQDDTQDNLGNINNAFVIVENRDGFPKQVDSGVGSIYEDKLCNWFSTLKGNGCKIMFISGMDETRYRSEYCDERYSEFLDYVDIHINTDILTVFMETLLDMIYPDTSNIENFTLFIERWMYLRVMYEYLLPDLLENCDLSSLNPDYTNLQSVMTALETLYHIQFIVQDDNVMRDLIYTESPFLTFNSDIDDITAYNRNDPDRTYAIGSTANWSTNTSAWADFIVSYRQLSGYNIPLFLYDFFDEDIDNYNNNTSIGYYCAWDVNIDSILSSIMNDFIMENDLSGYDNWPGRCEVTYKPITGDGGWLRVPRPRKSWKTIITPEELPG